MNRTLHAIVAAALLASAAPAAEKPWTVYTEWPFDAAEAKRRQKETADAMGIPVKKSVVIGKDAKGQPVTMEFMLIPAGTFVMGTPEPVKPVEPVDDTKSSLLMFYAGLTLAVSLAVLLGYRAIREKRWPQFSIAGLVLMLVAASVIVMGASQLRRYDLELQAFGKAMERHAVALIVFNSAEDNEKPAHEVTITVPFYLGRTEVTTAQWDGVIGKFITLRRSPQSPVGYITWYNCQTFLEMLSNFNVQLPTEAQWEYACRAGSASAFSFGSDEGQLENYAWHKGNSGSIVNPVGKKKPNAWGLFDMHGNALEWCQDWYGKDYYQNGPSHDPAGPADQHTYLPAADFTYRPEAFVHPRVVRGGLIYFPAKFCRSATRYGYGSRYRQDGLGFRVVIPATPTTP